MQEKRLDDLLIQAARDQDFDNDYVAHGWVLS